MATQTVTVIGLPAAQAMLKKVDLAVTTGMPLILQAGALPVMNKAKELAPYRTGTLRKSIHIEKASQTQVTVGTDVVYAAAQEFGRADINLPARPYLRPALDTSVAAATLSMQKALSALVGAI